MFRRAGLFLDVRPAVKPLLRRFRRPAPNGGVDREGSEIGHAAVSALDDAVLERFTITVSEAAAENKFQLWESPTELKITLPSRGERDADVTAIVKVVTGAKVALWLLMQRTSFAALRRFIWLRVQGTREAIDAAAFAQGFPTHLARSPYVGLETRAVLPDTAGMAARDVARCPDLAQRVATDAPSRFSLVQALKSEGVMPVELWAVAENRQLFNAEHAQASAAFDRADAAMAAAVPPDAPAEFKWQPDDMIAYFRSPAAQAHWHSGEHESSNALSILATAAVAHPALAEALCFTPALAVVSFRAQRDTFDEAGHPRRVKLDHELSGMERDYLSRTVARTLSATAAPVTAATLTAHMQDSKVDGLHAPMLSVTDMVRMLVRQGDDLFAVHPSVAADCGWTLPALASQHSRPRMLLIAGDRADVLGAVESGGGTSMLLVTASRGLLGHILAVGAPWISCAPHGSGVAVSQWYSPHSVRGLLRRFTQRHLIPHVVATAGITTLLNHFRRQSFESCVVVSVGADSRPLTVPVCLVQTMADAAGWSYVLGDTAGVLAMRRYLEMAAALYDDQISCLRRQELRGAETRQPQRITLTEAECAVLRHFAEASDGAGRQVILIDAGGGLLFVAAVNCADPNAAQHTAAAEQSSAT